MPCVVECFIATQVIEPLLEVPIWLIRQPRSRFSVGYRDADESNALPDMPRRLRADCVVGRPVLNPINSTCNSRKEVLKLLLRDGGSMYLAKSNIVGWECAMVGDSF